MQDEIPEISCVFPRMLGGESLATIGSADCIQSEVFFLATLSFNP
jgi:hypothetical protein